MSQDLSFGAKENSTSSLSQEAGFDISDLYQNEDSVDLSTYMTSANLELCDDELFQSLFPSSPDANDMVKKEKQDPYEELDRWNQTDSACSSRAQSPLQFYNPPTFQQPEVPIHNDRQTGFQSPQNSLTQLSMAAMQLQPIDFRTGANNLGLDPPNNENPMIQVTIKTEPSSSHSFSGNEVADLNNNQPVQGPPKLVKVVPKNFRKVHGSFGNSLNAADSDANLKRSIKDPNNNHGKLMKRQKFFMNKETEEYKERRERNNVAVRRSREKARIKSLETQQKVTELMNDNKRLNDRVSELSHELNTLKGILKSMPQVQTLQYNSENKGLKESYFNPTSS